MEMVPDCLMLIKGCFMKTIGGESITISSSAPCGSTGPQKYHLIKTFHGDGCWGEESISQSEGWGTVMHRAQCCHTASCLGRRLSTQLQSDKRTTDLLLPHGWAEQRLNRANKNKDDILHCSLVCVEFNLNVIRLYVRPHQGEMLQFGISP